MPPDCYKIEVIHYLNPHLIWIEVCDPSVVKDKFVFEQVGVYGVLPLEITLDIETEDVKSQKCERWLPAAAAVMKSVLDENSVWFSPTHIDRRTSIFDDNIHKYGDIIIKKNGKLKKLSEVLVDSGFAYFNICDFHEKLSGGKLKTKLSALKTQEVIKKLENFYSKMDKPKNTWKNSVDNQTTVFHMVQDFESSLTVSNIEKHNNQLISKTLHNKYKDFELCKDIEEESLGRACAKAKHKLNEDSSSQLFKRKLSIAKSKSPKEDPKKMYNDLCKFLDTNSNFKENLNVSYQTKTTNENCKVDVIKDENKDNFLSRKLKHLNKLDTVTKRTAESEPNHRKLSVENNLESSIAVDDFKNNHRNHDADKDSQRAANVICDNGSEKEPVKTTQEHKIVSDISPNKKYTETTKINKKDTKFKPCEEDKTIEDTVPDKATSQPIKTMKFSKSGGNKIRVAYGPPGLNPLKFKIQCMGIDDFFGTDEKTDIENKVDVQNYECMFGDVDSEVDIEITNQNTLNEYYKKLNAAANKSDILQSKEKLVRRGEEVNHSDDSIEKRTSSSGSLFLQRKLKAHRISALHNSSFSSSDTSCKDSSSDVTPLKETHNDDDIKDVVERLSVKYRDDRVKKEDKEIENITTKLKNNVNPFKNIDPSISAFVDKLVTPVLMVHSKHDKRIEPVFEIRDVYLNDHLNSILRNMSINRPMMLQTVSWFTILRGYSLFMISPSGSGKTLGYLPAVCRLVNDSNSFIVDSVGPICIIVCATARSVGAVEKMVKMFLDSKSKVLACYAGVDNFHITTTMLNGCDLLISTPSSLVRLLRVTDFGVDLRRLSTFVLDDCERLTNVYADEIKFFVHRIRQILKTRVNKELKVQYILASRVWCDFMESLAKKVPDTVICVGAFQECVLYSKANTSVSHVKSENKVDIVFEFLKEINASTKTVIVCQSDEEVRLLEKAVKRSKHVVFACDSSMTIHDLYNLSVSWADYEEPLIGPILICCDGNLIHMNITDAHNLIHYSLPPLFSMFCKRFSVLNDNYPSIFKTDNETVKVKILLENCNVEQLPKILNFIKRCTDNVPDFLDAICSNILAEKDLIKAQNLYPICDRLLALGYCPDIYNCLERHTILKDYDAPKNWLPKEGIITCEILYYHSATLYSARLLSCTANGITTNYPQTYSKLSLKMGLYFSKESNKKLHGIPKVGDICATSVKLNFYARCQVLKIISKYEKGNPNNVLVKLIDEERLEVTRDIYLYYLPEDLKCIESQVVQVRLANVEPRDRDITFSDLARNTLRKITDADSALFVRGNVSLVLGNCIFVDTLEACQILTSLNEVVVKFNMKRELLENHAILNPEHLNKLEKLCSESGFEVVKQETMQPKSKMPIKNLPRGTWAHLNSDSLSCVFFASAVTPDKFFVRLEKFEFCMSSLLQDIKKYVETNPTDCVNVKEGEIVLAKFPDDSTYERARIDGIIEDKVKCFFVDQGDWREVPLIDLKPITEQFINQLPFQAIECRLIGIQPVGGQWTDFSTNWFCDKWLETNGDLKQLFLKYFTKEPAEFTNGHKYSVVLVDTTTSDDVVLNKLMIELNLAQENDEMNLDDFKIHTKPVKEIQSSESELDDWESLSVNSPINCHKDEENRNNDDNLNISSPSNILFKPPIRSVPLVSSDNESDISDKWDISIDDNFVKLFPTVKVLKDLKENITEVNTLEKPAASENKIKGAEIIELSSDDLTLTDAIVSNVSPEKPMLNIDQKRCPKLVWHQNKNSVTVKIQLVSADNYNLDIDDRVLNFSADLCDTEYAFELELYGVVDKDKCMHVNKGQYILVKLSKVFSKNWLTLTRDGGIKKWIVYDVDNLDTSSEDEAKDDSSIKNIVRNIHNNVESESDDDLIDDVNRSYKKYN